MQAWQLAEKIRARQIGPNRWQTLCPHHRERRPSLDFKQGERGILVRCRSQNCSIADICKAWGFPVRALFDDENLTPEQQNGLAKTRARQAAVEAAQNERERQLLDEFRRLGKLRKQVEARMISEPNNAAFNQIHGVAMARIREIAAMLWPDLFEDGPLRSEPVELPWCRVAEQLDWIGKKFNTKNEEATLGTSPLSQIERNIH